MKNKNIGDYIRFAAIVAALLLPAIFWGNTIRYNNERALNENLLAAPGESNPFVSEKIINSMLYGDFTFSFSANDSITNEPVPAFKVHCYIKQLASIPSERSDNYISKVGQGDLLRSNIGNLESKEINNSDGICIYENLPSGKYFFVIEADGYVNYGFEETIDKDGIIRVVDLIPGCIITGRLIDAQTKKGIHGIQLTGICNEKKPEDSDSVTEWTDEEGYFRFSGVAEGDCRIEYTGCPTTFDSVRKILESKSNFLYGSDTSKNQELFQQNYPNNFYMRKKDVTISTERGKTYDLGTIELHKYPVLEINIVDEEDNPVTDFKYTIFLNSMQTINSHTDKDGKSRQVLAGFKEGGEICICLPDAMVGIYKITPPSTPDKWSGFNEAAEKEQILKNIDTSGENKDDEINDLLKLKKVNFDLTKSLPEHPNVKYINPKPDEVVKITMVYHPIDKNMQATLLVTDAATGVPVQTFSGKIYREKPTTGDIIGNNSNNEIYDRFNAPIISFKSSGNSGKVLLKNLTVGAELILLDRALNKDNNVKNQPLPQEAYNKKIYVLVEADGYLKKIVPLTYQDLKEKKEIEVKVKPDVILKGRICLNGSGLPVNKENLLAALEQSSYKDSYFEKRQIKTLTKDFNPVSVLMYYEPQHNARNNQNADDAPPTDMNRGKLDANGYFTINNLTPGNGWTLRVLSPIFPEHRKKNIQLEEGINDIGTIYIGFAEKLTGIISDENNVPLPGAYISFPAEQAIGEPRNLSLTNEHGSFVFDKGKLTEPEQILRITPPWGHVSEGHYIKHNIYYDIVREIDRFKEEQIFPRVSRGNTLIIKIEETTKTTEILDYINTINKEYSGRLSAYKKFSQNIKAFFKISNIVVTALTPDVNGMLYTNNSRPDAPLTTGTLVFNVKNVPPGKHALKIDGAIDLKSPSQLFHISDDGDSYLPGNLKNTIIYNEFDMPATTHTLVLKMHNSNLKIMAENSAGAVKKFTNMNDVYVLEKKTPQYIGTLISPTVLQKLAVLNQNERNALPFRYPLVMMCNTIMASGETLFSIPPGDYTIRFYQNFEDFLFEGMDPFYKKDFTIPEQGAFPGIFVPESVIPKSNNVYQYDNVTEHDIYGGVKQ